MPGRIRPATLADAPLMLTIYSVSVLETPISWEYEVPSDAEFEGRVQKVLLGGHPWLVLEDAQGTIAGYAYASHFRDRFGYRFCCESSIYMRADTQGKGLGKHLYSTLLEILRRQGFVAVIAGVTYPNPASEGLHKSLGFGMVGIHHQIGYKFDQWHSACFMQKELSPRGEPVGEKPLRFDELLASGRLSDLLG